MLRNQCAISIISASRQVRTGIRTRRGGARAVVSVELVIHRTSRIKLSNISPLIAKLIG